MKTFVLVVAVTAALTSTLRGSQGPAVGLWDSATTQGGIGTTLELRADGVFVQATTVIVNLYYRVIGDRVVVGMQPPAADASVSQSMAFDGDVLVMTSPDGSVARKERMGAAPIGKFGLTGAWRYRHSTGATAFERYTDDGRVFLRIPMRSASGHYTLQDGQLLLVQPGQPDVRMAVEIHGDAMVLSTGARRTDYSRDPGGAWYDAEHIVQVQSPQGAF